MHWDRNKSTDQADCILRHMVDRGKVDADGLRHSAKVAWRALALLQVEIENTGKTPPVEEEIKAKMEAAVLDKLDSALKEEACVNDRLRRQCVFDEQGKRRVRDDGAVAFFPEELELVESAREPEVAECIVPKDRGVCYTYYIAGPMRGLPELNFPAFDAAKDFLIAQGLNVISPADMDREHGEEPVANGVQPSYIYAQRDTQALIRLAEDNEKFGLQNGIYMLRGWQASKGASAEHQLAQWLGLDIVYQPE
jgi:hypothetical protein